MSVDILDQKTKCNLEIHKGCDYFLQIQMTDFITGDPIDITGYTITATVREERKYISSSISDFVISVTAATTGYFLMEISDTVTACISQDYGYYTVIYEDTNNYKDVLIHGEITFFETT